MTDADVYQRLGLLEAQMRYLSERTGIPLPDFAAVAGSGLSPQMQAEIAKGNKINAIKLYRESTGCDLATAKKVIESYGG
jgi:ribosomal protein L7/L12